MLESVFLFWPVAVTAFAGLLIHAGLRESRKFYWGRIATGLVLLAFVCYWLFQFSSWGEIAPAGALFVGFFCACAALAFGLWMIWSLETWRKTAALMLGVAFPVLMFYSVQGGSKQSPESITQRNGDAIVEALNEYHAQHGKFPSELIDLEPEFMIAQPEAVTTQGTGWLYMSNGASFTLGYWYWPEKMGASVCLHASLQSGWECGLNNWGDFRQVPTPGPCKNQEGVWVNSVDCK